MYFKFICNLTFITDYILAVCLLYSDACFFLVIYVNVEQPAS